MHAEYSKEFATLWFHELSGHFSTFADMSHTNDEIVFGKLPESGWRRLVYCGLSLSIDGKWRSSNYL